MANGAVYGVQNNKVEALIYTYATDMTIVRAFDLDFFEPEQDMSWSSHPNSESVCRLGKVAVVTNQFDQDVNSLCLTVVNRLLKRTGTKPTQIGRMEVGTETIIDKSKSVKSVLMKLFMESGNTDLEGVDSTNVCYGGTAALFNSINWVESSAWDGRLALAVCADIGVYAAGAARPSGGAGAVSMLIGPHAPLVLDRGVRATHMQHVYYFYKPSSEYPVVDPMLSIQCYLSALDKCYAKYKTKADSKGIGPVSLDSFNGVLFHTPYCKLVQKSLARLSLNDYLDTPEDVKASKHPELEKMRDTKLEESYFDRDVEKAFMAHSQNIFESKTKPGFKVAANVGNMYTPCLYGGLVSYMISKPPVLNLLWRTLLQVL